MKDSLIPTRSEIKEELQRIWVSKRFKKAGRSLRLLRLLIAAHLSRRSLTEERIGIKIFARRKGWAPTLDSIVRVGRHNLQIYLLEYYAAEGASNPLLIQVPDGGSYRVAISYNPKSVAERACAKGMSKLPELFLNGPITIRWLKIGSEEAYCGGEPINPEGDFEAALRSDPSNVEALVGRAEAHLIRAFLWDGRAAVHISRAEADLNVALDLIEAYQPACETLAGLYCCQSRWEKAGELFGALMKDDPSVRNRSFWYVLFLLGQQKTEEALQITCARASADPRDPLSATIYGFVLYMTRHFNYAEVILRNAVEIRRQTRKGNLVAPQVVEGQGNYLASFLLGCVCLALDRHDEALVIFRRCSIYWFLCGFISVAHANQGDQKTAEELAAIFHTYGTFTLYRPAIQEALAYMATGKHEDAIHLLLTACVDGDPWITCLPVWPILDPLRTHQNFANLLQKLRNRGK